MFEESKGTLVMLGTGMGRLGRAHYEISFEANPASVPFPWVRRGQLWAGSGWPVGKATQTPLVTTLPFSQLSQPLGFPYDHVTDDSIAPRPLKGAHGSSAPGRKVRLAVLPWLLKSPLPPSSLTVPYITGTCLPDCHNSVPLHSPTVSSVRPCVRT